MKPNETLLLQQLKEGNSTAYRHLYDNHYKILCHIASQYLHDDYMAETVVGDVIFQIWKMRDRLNVQTSLRQYLLRAVRNKCLDILKSDYANHELSLSSTDRSSLEYIGTIADDNHPLGSLLENELEGVLAEAISELPEDTRRVFEMSRFENMKYNDIAQQLGISTTAVEKHISKALKTIAAQLAQKYGTTFALCLMLCLEHAQQAV